VYGPASSSAVRTVVDCVPSGCITLIQQTKRRVRWLNTMWGRSIIDDGCNGESASSSSGGTMSPRSVQSYRSVDE
jgi:hypothetical protein